jgi:hypothetical protein
LFVQPRTLLGQLQFWVRCELRRVCGTFFCFSLQV